MYSLNARLLISVSLLLLLFFGATIVVLDTAFRTAGEQAREDILDGHLMSLLSVAEVGPDGQLGLRRELPEHQSRDAHCNSKVTGLQRSGCITWVTYGHCLTGPKPRRFA